MCMRAVGCTQDTDLPPTLGTFNHITSSHVMLSMVRFLTSFTLPSFHLHWTPYAGSLQKHGHYQCLPYLSTREESKGISLFCTSR